MEKSLSWKDVKLGDDGTLDTVLWIDGCEHRYSQDFGAEYRHQDGSISGQAWKSLARECLDDHLINCVMEG